MNKLADVLLENELARFKSMGFENLKQLAQKRYADSLEKKDKNDTEYQIEITVRWSSFFHRSIRVEADIENMGSSQSGKTSGWRSVKGFIITPGDVVEDI